MKTIFQTLRFRIMLAPYLLEVLFWAAMAGTLYGSAWLYLHDNWAWWMALVFGTILVRLLFEFALLAFRSYEALHAIRETTDQLRAQVQGAEK